MKKIWKVSAFIFVTLGVASSTWAGRMNEVVILSLESIEQKLGLDSAAHQYQVLHQEFTTTKIDAGLAVQTQLVVTHILGGTTQQWTCVTQFVRTARFFEVLKTECK